MKMMNGEEHAPVNTWITLASNEMQASDSLLEMKQAIPEAAKVDADSGSTEDCIKLNLSPDNDYSSDNNMSSWCFSS